MTRKPKLKRKPTIAQLKKRPSLWAVVHSETDINLRVVYPSPIIAPMWGSSEMCSQEFFGEAQWFSSQWEYETLLNDYCFPCEFLGWL